MHLTGQYDTNWAQSEIFLSNSSSRQSKTSIRFYDENGKIIHKINEFDIPSFGSIIIELQKITQLPKNKHGLFIIDCHLGIRGEFRYRADDGPLRTTSPLREGIPPFSAEGPTIFISYAMKKENDQLYDFISRTLKALGAKVLSASESGRIDLPPGIHIKDMIRESNAVVAILTQDIKSEEEGKSIHHPSHNVTDEIGQSSEKPVLLLVEENVRVPSNLQTRGTYLTFSRYDQGEVIVKLIEAIRKMGVF